MRVGLRRTLAAVAAASVLVLAGCSGSGDGDAASPAPTGTPSAGTPSPTLSPSPSLATLPADRCLTGTWRLVRFVGAQDQTYGTGQGGDVTVRFADDGYILSGAGKEPLTITLAGRNAELTIDGTAKGEVALDSSTATFSQRSASGSARLRGGESSERLSMAQVTSVVGLQGDGQVACTADAMTITLSTVRLELVRG